MTSLSEIPSNLHLMALRNKIAWLCNLVRWLIVAWLLWRLWVELSPLLAPVQTAAEWNSYWNLPPETVTVQKVFMNRAIFLFDWAIAAMMGLAVWRLMSGFLTGDILSAAAAHRLKQVGTWGLAEVAVDIAVRPLVLGIFSKEILTRFTAFDWIDPRDLLYVVIALFVIALGIIQGAAAEISDENRRFV